MTTIRQCHSVDMSHNSSCLDHLLLSRGDSTSACVFGDARCGIQYGLLAIDYILCKLLSNQRYRRVICICFDRRSDSIISTAEAYFAQLQAGDSPDSKSIAAEKLRIIEASITDPNILKEVLDATAQQISSDQTSTSTIKSVSPKNQKDRNQCKGFGSKSTAIIVYSLSEIVLAIGFTRAMHFISQLQYTTDALTTLSGDVIEEEGGRLDGASDIAPKVTVPSSSSSSVSVIALVHTTLHSAQTLSRFLPRPKTSSFGLSSSSSYTGNPFSASVIVKPNDGSLSAQIVCEVQVTRVSSSTGKVTEASNYFTEGAGQVLLVPILKSRAKREEEEEPALLHSATAVTSGTFGHSNSSATAMKGVGQDREQTRIASVGTSTSTGTGTRNNAQYDNRRLITFDSTDPEFDEDSDPDADLDL